MHELVGHTAMLGVPEWAELNVLFGEADMRTESEAAITRLGSVIGMFLNSEHVVREET